jgi:hypothetical protein
VAFCLALFLLGGAGAHAADERDRIRAERAEAEAAYQSQVRACQDQFAVTACMDQVKAQHRSTLARLSHQQELLDAIDRRQRAAQRMKEIDEKVNSGDSTSRSVPKPPAITVRAPREAPSSAMPPVQSPTRASVGTGPSAVEQESNRADYERRQREALAHRAEVQRRDSERQAKGAPSPSLPERPEIPPSTTSP